ncbi:Zinc finger CCCH domain-containing protein 33 [Platanthera guangdongensis]|uniref:Zinc finger CCCH domain-containing protein 33 n=1 Tax=Platanthera guangdongensis TaxID=2320717 RepID=A0ABR2MH99_9ASPA
MGLREEPVLELDNRLSIVVSPSIAESTETIIHGVDSLRLPERALRRIPAAGNANIEDGEVVRYPLRPTEPDCGYYLKTGCCKFGYYCRFNHPRERRLLQIFNSKERDKESPKQIGQCKFYLMPGGCKYGEACRYSYSHGKAGSLPVELNVIGLPVRPGERECPYYCRTGACKYSTTCRFHHPEPSYFTGAQGFGFQTTISFENKIRNLHLLETSRTSNGCIPMLDTSKPPYVPAMSFSQWLNLYMNNNRCPDSSLSTSEKTNGFLPSVVNQKGHSKLADSSIRMSETICENTKDSHSELESQICTRYKDFKLALACTQNCSKDCRPSQLEACYLSPIGLPLRPDQPVCIYYGCYGICKYGPACEFDHPMDRNLDQSSYASLTTTTRSVDDEKMEGNEILD